MKCYDVCIGKWWVMNTFNRFDKACAVAYSMRDRGVTITIRKRQV